MLVHWFKFSLFEWRQISQLSAETSSTGSCFRVIMVIHNHKIIGPIGSMEMGLLLLTNEAAGEVARSAFYLVSHLNLGPRKSPPDDL